MIVEIRGHDLPGASCGPSPEGGRYEHVHVGLARGTETVELFSGDAPSASWELEVMLREGPDGEIDYRGPFVRGKRGDRHLALRWGTVGDGGRFDVFRAAKLRIDRVDDDLIAEAAAGGRLVASIDLTDEHGWPRCATVHPPSLVWSFEN